MKRLLPIAASLALIIAASATAQDAAAPATASPVQDAASAAPVAAEPAAPAQAESFSEQDIADIAAYLSSIK